MANSPSGLARGIYSRFGYQFTSRFEGDGRKFLQTEPIKRQYKHAYTLEQFELFRALIMDRSAEYLAWVE